MNDSLKKKIKLAGDKLDKIVDFGKIASKVENKAVSFVVRSFELVDGWVFRTALAEVVDLLPDTVEPVIESWIDAFLAEDYLVLVDATGDFLARLNLIPFIEDDDEKNVYVALLSALVKLIPPMTRPDEAA